jgi:hypothetical protein
MVNLKRATLSAVTLVVLSSSVTMAQLPGRDRSPPPPPPPPTGVVDKLTVEDLGNMLKELGYEFTTVKLNNGVIAHRLNIPHKNRNVPLDISLSSSGSKVWMSVWFTPLPAGQTIPTFVMVQMLETNHRLGPCHFALGAQKQLSLSLSLDNRSLNSEEMRRWIDYYLLAYDQTENLWNSSRWNTQAGKRG